MRGAFVAAACAVALCGCLEAPPGAHADAAVPDASTPCVAPVFAASTLTSCALLADGTVRCMGFDDNGELGNDADLDGSGEPVPVADLDEVTALAGGSYGFCALRADGRARCWGNNTTGQLGDQTMEDRATPVDVLDLADILDIALGDGHACAVIDGLSVWCWGRNNNGQLGNGVATETSPAPVQAMVLSAIDVEASYGATCVILDDEIGVACWGQTSGGFNSNQVIEYPMTGVVDLSMRSHSVYAVLDDGTVMAWGDNEFGQLGDDTVVSRPEPQPVQGLPPAVAVAAGGDHVCALVEGGDVWCWGRNRYGQLGRVNRPDEHLPRLVEDIPRAVQLVSGQEHTCATSADGETTCWGHDCCGQLGPRAKDPTAPPGPVGVAELCVVPP
ncbi:MAG TPA: hypothetical protein VMZ28_05670 [Kofleriaceae bacterium]|nr:hypothetical protein [Kofleriaceae bacterium]